MTDEEVRLQCLKMAFDRTSGDKPALEYAQNLYLWVMERRIGPLNFDPQKHTSKTDDKTALQNLMSGY